MRVRRRIRNARAGSRCRGARGCASHSQSAAHRQLFRAGVAPSRTWTRWEPPRGTHRCTAASGGCSSPPGRQRTSLRRASWTLVGNLAGTRLTGRLPPHRQQKSWLLLPRVTKTRRRMPPTERRQRAGGLSGSSPKSGRPCTRLSRGICRARLRGCARPESSSSYKRRERRCSSHRDGTTPFSTCRREPRSLSPRTSRLRPTCPWFWPLSKRSTLRWHSPSGQSSANAQPSLRRDCGAFMAGPALSDTVGSAAADGRAWLVRGFQGHKGTHGVGPGRSHGASICLVGWACRGGLLPTSLGCRRGHVWPGRFGSPRRAVCHPDGGRRLGPGLLCRGVCIAQCFLP